MDGPKKGELVGSDDGTNYSALSEITPTGATEAKVAELTESLVSIRSDYEEFKRTSSTEREALRKELDTMKALQGSEATCVATNEEVMGNDCVPTCEANEDSNKVKCMAIALSNHFDNDGYMKCCLP